MTTDALRPSTSSYCRIRGKSAMRALRQNPPPQPSRLPRAYEKGTRREQLDDARAEA